MQLIIQNILRRKSFTNPTGEEIGEPPHSPRGIRLEGMKGSILCESLELDNGDDTSPKHTIARDRRPVLHEPPRSGQRESRETSRERAREMEETIPEEGLSRSNSGNAPSTSSRGNSGRRRPPPLGTAGSGVVPMQPGGGGAGASPRLSGFQKLAAASQAAVVPRVAASGRARMTSDWRRGSMPAATLASDINKLLSGTGTRLQTTAMLESDEEGEEN